MPTEARGKDAGAAEPPAEEGALRAIVAGLIARVESSPLMQRPPTGASPEEQQRLITVLSGLAQLRSTQAALAGVPDVSPDVVAEVWPELAAVLAPSRGAGSRRPAASRGGAGGTSPARASKPARRPGEPAPPPAAGDGETAPVGSAETATAAATPSSTAPDSGEGAQQQSPQAPAAAEPVPSAPARAARSSRVARTTRTTSQDLREVVRAILQADKRPLSGARIASQVQETNPQATREQVYDTLYRAADLFRKTSQGWELVTPR
jgi:hypothetical protein